MFKPFYGNCINKDCGRTNVVIPVKSGLCQYCNHELKKSKKKPAEKPKLPKKKPTGEYALFMAIGAVRPHQCFICNKKLNQLTVSNFMHVLPKGKFEKFRLYDKNIVIGCHDFESSCHDVWDKQPRSNIKDNPMWEKMFELESKLKEEYNNQ